MVNVFVMCLRDSSLTLRMTSPHFGNAVLSQPAGRDLATLPATDCCRRCRSLRLSVFFFLVDNRALLCHSDTE